MKNIFIIIIFLIILIVIALMVLGYRSHSGAPAGMPYGRLTKCPDKPNCVCSEYKDDTAHYIDPLIIPEITETTRNILMESIQEAGGTIQTAVM